MGRLEIWIKPSNGWSSSRLRKIAPDTDAAAMNGEALATGIIGATNPQLRKMIASD